MALLDSKGRLFGKVSILDLGALLIILGVVFGIFFLPGRSGSVAQIGSAMEAIEVEVLVRGLSVKSPETFVAEFQGSETTSIVIRNQPFANVGIKSIELLPRTTPVPQPDGSVLPLNDPRPEVQNIGDFRIVLTSEAQKTDNGYVFGNNKVKIGHTLRLEGFNYDFNGSVIDIRAVEK
ncbi:MULTISPECIES: DUF4330 domain-containing protein [Cyanophyceae]|uniref:DUF4330 domain-containing protein n=1 Tax=Cyanophyceae TaxID=3028117 RepID=UPI00016DC64B|nr:MULTISPECIES: DUF4330 domain-containing protein [Cyanophyceae]ACA98692.1 conserved hypothetical protein [Picosynechococcus sp. PCC 7002]SMH39740.1 protein of unknown function [Picosynechococcus sp. OG1]SMQ78257.1 protein of unknown function [Synechococcus sp. 7002]